MANPNPQHTPTDGLGTAAFMTLTCSSPTALTKVGSSVALSPGNRVGGNQYALTLSVAGTGAPIYSTVTIVPLVVDVKGNTFTSGNGNVPKGRVYPSGNTAQGTEGVYVVNQGVPNWITLTANKVGQYVVEVYFPFADGPTTVSNPNYGANLPADVISDLSVASDGDFIYAQILVTVVA